MIYFVRNPGDGTVKVGHSLNPDVRLIQLQAACARKLELLGTINGDVEVEQRLHAVLAPYRMEGEWFRGADEVLRLILLLCRGGFVGPAEIHPEVASLRAKLQRAEEELKRARAKVSTLTDELARMQVAARTPAESIEDITRRRGEVGAAVRLILSELNWAGRLESGDF